MAGYCSEFIPDFATINEPLRMLTEQGVPWSWTQRQQSSFDTIKEELCSGTTLAHFDATAETELIVDGRFPKVSKT